MKHRFINSAVFVFVILGMGNSYASEMFMSINSMSCTPTSTTLHEQKYITSGGRVKFKEGVTGTISFICPFPPVTKKKDIGMRLTMDYYKESSDSQISAAVKRVNRGTGAVEELFTLQAKMQGHSDAFGHITSDFIRKLSFEDYSYYIQFTLKQDQIEKGNPPEFGGGARVPFRMAVLNFLVFLND